MNCVPYHSITQNRPGKHKTSSNNSSQGSIDLAKARDVARGFLQQLHSTVIFKEGILKANVWTITMDVGLIGERLIRVKVDAYSGQILGYV